jgi:hypothetical protein
MSPSRISLGVGSLRFSSVDIVLTSCRDNEGRDLSIPSGKCLTRSLGRWATMAAPWR